MIKYKTFFILCILLFIKPNLGFTIEFRDLLEKTKVSFQNQNHYSTLNLCREIIKSCENNPAAECWHTNVIKDVYRYKGITEFEIYKKERKPKRLTDAIESLTISFKLYHDPEILFIRGYLESLLALTKKDLDDLGGLITAWEALLDLYARNEWNLSDDIIAKVKLYIRAAEKFAVPVPRKHYSGIFAKFMIVMSCDLVTRKNLSEDDSVLFKKIRLKYNRTEGRQWEDMRNNLLSPNN